jgi:hypothetical protein
VEDNMKSLHKLNVGKLTLVLAITGALAQLASADSINNCTGARPIPCYTIGLTVPGSLENMRTDSELSPVDGNLSGLDLVGSGSAFAVARFGSVGAKTEVTETSLFGDPVSAFGQATFQDVFFWNGGAGKLRFTLNLDGITSATGAHPGANVAGVDATLSLSSTISPDETAFGELTAPGSMTVTIDMLPFDGVNFALDLRSFVALTEFGHGLSDFIDTAGIARIEELDRSGNLLRDTTLTDVKGNVLGGAPVAAVPEPGSGGLAAIALLLLVLGRQSQSSTKGEN